MNLLTSLDLEGFKSIRELNQLPLGPLNVLIGANGAGKSNLISFFKLLNWMTFAPEQLQFYIGKAGGAHALLFDGAATTPQIRTRIAIETESGLNEYQIRLFHAAPDTLIFAEEKFRFSRKGRPIQANWTSLGTGHRESNLLLKADEGDKTAKTILELLKRCVVYQFHDTSATARIKSHWDVNDSRNLRDDGANLAAVLYRLQEKQNRYYRRIVDVIRQVAPFFLDFVLEPDFGKVFLQWRERNTDLIFSSDQASDGTLRMMALVTLLLQPTDNLPNLILLDEPELGLHPYAINILAGLIKSVSLHRQIILATQSMTLIDYFEPQDIIVVDRPNRESIYTKLDAEQLQEWLAEYSLAELWEKNVIGGRPA